jgi:hypothetical protein
LKHRLSASSHRQRRFFFDIRQTPFQREWTSNCTGVYSAPRGKSSAGCPTCAGLGRGIVRLEPDSLWLLTSLLIAAVALFSFPAFSDHLQDKGRTGKIQKDEVVAKGGSDCLLETIVKGATTGTKIQ